MMDIDDAVGEAVDEIRAEDPHILGQDDIVRPDPFQLFDDVSLLFLAGNIQMAAKMERSAKLFHIRFEDLVIADDVGDLGIDFIESAAGQNIRQAMSLLVIWLVKKLPN